MKVRNSIFSGIIQTKTPVTNLSKAMQNVNFGNHKILLKEV